MYGPGDIEAATNGYITRRALHSWHARNLWLTRTEVPPSGKSYSYSEANFAEAIIVGELTKRGFSNETARAVIRRRLNKAFSGGTGYTDRFAGKLADLPEIKNRRGFWLIFSHTDGQWGGLVPDGTIFCVKATDIATHIEDQPFAEIMNVGDVFKRADGFLRKKKP